MSLLSLDRSQNDSRLIVFLTKGKIVFHMSILSLVCSENGFASGRLSYEQDSTYRPRPTYYVYCFGICVSVRMYGIIIVFMIQTIDVQVINRK